jgi:hypothetical protein
MVKLSTLSIPNFARKTPRVHLWVFFLHYNTPAHRSLAIQIKLAYLGFLFLDHPPHSPELTPSYCQQFSGLKITI